MDVLLPLLVAVPTLYRPSVTRAGAGSVALPLLNAAPTIPLLGVGQHTSPNGTNPAPYLVRTVNVFGSLPTVLASSVPETITWTLNQPDKATGYFPKALYSESDIPTYGVPSAVREVQIFRDGDLMFWGPMTQPNAAGSKGQVDFECEGVDGYFNARAIDGPRPNYITDPSFENFANDWVPTEGLIPFVTTDKKILGSNSLRLWNNRTNAYVEQKFTAGPNGVGLLLTVSAWFFIEFITGNATPDLRGIYLEGGRGSTVQDFNYWAIDTATPQRQWIRAEFTLRIPPNQAWNLRLRLYAPPGSVLYDAIQVVAMDSTSTAGITGDTTTEVDVARIVPMIVKHLQDPGSGKSNVNIGTMCDTTGIKMVKHYQWAEHVQYDQAMSEFIDRDDGIDVWVDYTPTTRSLRCAPRKGVDRDITLTYGTSDVADYRWRKDGPATITRATTMGEGDGPDREEGEYVDASQIGGLILQEIRQAPPSTQINSLLPLARERVRRRKSPPRLLEVDINASAGLIHVLKTGDTVVVVINDGYVQVNARLRVVQLVLYCASGKMSATFNEEL